MNIELPKDAEGREIPLDTVVLFGGNDNAYNITGWIYVTDFDLNNSMAGQWRALTDKFTRLDPELMYLTPSDSWEKLLEDLGEAGDSNTPTQPWTAPRRSRFARTTGITRSATRSYSTLS